MSALRDDLRQSDIQSLQPLQVKDISNSIYLLYERSIKRKAMHCKSHSFLTALYTDNDIRLHCKNRFCQNMQYDQKR